MLNLDIYFLHKYETLIEYEDERFNLTEKINM